jgi:hypothetical protein
MKITFDTRRVLAQLGGAGALFTCFAVVLNSVQMPNRPTTQAYTLPAAPDPMPPKIEAAAAVEYNNSPGQAAPSSGPPKLQLLANGQASAGQAIQVAIAGVWAPDAGSCSLRDFRKGLLPTVINSDGAWAGETFCMFKNHKETEQGWSVVAACSNSRDQWTTRVSLTVKGERLVWTSRRGTQTYTRCAPDFMVADLR